MNYSIPTITPRPLFLIYWLSALIFSHPCFADENAQIKSEGQAEYEIACMSCHGLDGKGDGPQAKKLSIMPADLTRLAQSRNGQFPDREIYDLIDGRGIIPAHGRREMPIWGLRYRAESLPEVDLIQREKRTRQLIENLVAYLKQIQVK